MSQEHTHRTGVVMEEMLGKKNVVLKVLLVDSATFGGKGQRQTPSEAWTAHCRKHGRVSPWVGW